MSAHARSIAARLISLWMVLVLLAPLALGCGLLRRPATPTSEPTVAAPTPVATPGPAVSAPAVVSGAIAVSGKGGPLSAQGGSGGMSFTLGEGSEAPPAPAVSRLVEGSPLAPEALQALLRRLPPLEGVEGDQQAFRLPTQTLKPPRPGETLEQPFPPVTSAGAVEKPPVGPLKVLRFSPEGRVPLAPFLSVTFDQPMVALGTVAQVASQDVPVSLDPLPEGAWRWVGTQTLMFEPVTRFPMATEYTAIVPAGVRSALGGALEQEVRWTFATPPVEMTASYPNGGPTIRQPLIYAAFNQRIIPEDVLETVSLSAGGRTYAVRQATSQEVAADEAVRAMSRAAGEGRWVAFLPADPLPYATTVTVNVGPNTPSAEGPLLTESPQSFSFSTYGPLFVGDIQCGWEKECRPLAPWTISFSNPLDEAAFDAASISVTPTLSDIDISANGASVTIRGNSTGRTTYTIVVRAGIPDVFGQTLEQEATLSVRVGSAEPSFYVPGQNFVVLDPAAPPRVSMYSINFDSARVRAYAVLPEQWPDYQKYLQATARDQTRDNPPGKSVLDQRIDIRGKADALIETPIDLAALKGKGHRHLILVIEPSSSLLDNLRGRRPPVFRLWVQMSDIAVDALKDSEEIVAWATSLTDGSPVSGARLTLSPGGATATTGADGLARLGLAPSGGDAFGYIVARLGDDAAILPESAWSWGTSWVKSYIQGGFRWYVWDDRRMYRPAEDVHIKGWARYAHLYRGADSLSLPGTGTVSWEVTDAQGNSVGRGSTRLNALGGFDFTFTLPEAMNLGGAGIRLLLSSDKGQADYYHQIQVQEFRRPEFEVTARASEGPHLVGGEAIATVKAAYYAGGALPGADVRWTVTAAAGTFRPPNWDDFDFGYWTPWWWGWRKGGYVPSMEDTRVKEYSATTDAGGEHALRIAFESVDPPKPTVVTAEASVMDVNRQAWAASTSLLVHPAALYVGLRSQPTFVERGTPIQVEAIVTDLDGKPATGVAIDLRSVRLKWTYVKGEWTEVAVDEQVCAIKSAADPVRCTFQTTEGGTYRLTATIADPQGRKNVTQLTRWVSGGRMPTARRIELENVTLIPNRAEYQPGDTAAILVQAPFTPAEGLLTVRRTGLVSTERFTMDEPSVTLHVPIGEEDIPNVTVQVDVVGAAQRLNAAGEPDAKLPARPAYAAGSLDLRVPAYSRTLSVEVAPRQAEVEPGGTTTVDVQVRDANGQAVPGAEVALVVVDEAVLALTGYTLADPIAVFYPDRYAGVEDYRLRQYVMLANPELLGEQMVEEVQAVERGLKAFGAMPAAPTAMPAAEAAQDENVAGPAIRIRSDFNPLAVFAPETPTDADGSASVTVKVPDNLTRYRIMAVAVSGEIYYGKAESSLTARLPLMVRPSAPRFLNFGDRFDLPVVLQNQTDAAMDVDVAVRAANLTLSAGAGKRVTIPARDRIEVRFPAATDRAGTARLMVGAASGAWADAAQLSLPVYTPATTEAFATYGVVDAGAVAQPIVAPTGVFTQFGGLEITTSSTALQALTDAVLYLIAYPYECSEQLASRILAVAALRDVLEAFEAEGLPPPDEIDKAVNRDIARLQALQNYDGGFPIWTRGKESWPFYTIHAAHALARARQKDYAVSDETIQRALAYLRDIESHYPSWYSEDIRTTLTAYALYARMQLGDFDPARARSLVQQAGIERMQPEALGWTYNVLIGDAASQDLLRQIERHLGNRVVETAGAAHFATSFREQDAYVLLASDRRADGIILEGLMRSQPASDLIPKIVKGLLAHRKAGRWYNTQDNVFVLLALDRYFNTYEAQTPDFVARAWLGSDYVGAFTFRGRTTEYQNLTLPMAYVASIDGQQDLILSKEGPGRLYYRLGLRYAPTSLRLDPLDQGFVVERRYEAVDDPADVTQDRQGVWRIKAGARVRVRLTMVAPTRRYHVALADPLPAGLEPMNPALAVTGSIPQDPTDTGVAPYWWWRWTWYEHQNLRDQRAEAFASLLWEGIHTYTYVTRATTPGEYVVPPAKAEEMYAPETFGRSGSDRVIVE